MIKTPNQRRQACFRFSGLSYIRCPRMVDDTALISPSAANVLETNDRLAGFVLSTNLRNRITGQMKVVAFIDPPHSGVIEEFLSATMSGSTSSPHVCFLKSNFLSVISSELVVWQITEFNDPMIHSADLDQGRSDQDSSPCPTQPQSHVQTPAASRHRRRLPRWLEAGSSNQRRGRRRCQCT